MKGTYIDILPLDIQELIYNYILKSRHYDLMNELKYQLNNQLLHNENDNINWTLYEKLYYNYKKKIKYLNELSRPNYKKSCYFSYYLSRWLHKYYINLDNTPMVNGNIIYNKTILELIHTYHLIYEHTLEEKMKLIILKLDYSDLKSLFNTL